MKKRFIGIDIGGSFLKGIAVEVEDGETLNVLPERSLVSKVSRCPSCLGDGFKDSDFQDALFKLIRELVGDLPVAAIGISTAGIVDYAGKKVLLVSEHLRQLQNSSWTTILQEKYGVPVSIINDADAASIGAAALGYLQGYKTIGVMPVGTGVGFTVWRNGRKLTPFYGLPLLGSCYSYPTSYDALVSASGLAQSDSEKNLLNIFSLEKYAEVRDTYIQKLAGVIQTANVLYHTEELLIGGGLASAVKAAQYPLAERLTEALNSKDICIKVMDEGNMLPLIGAVLLGASEQSLSDYRDIRNYANKTTELPYNDTLRLNELGSRELVDLCWRLEEEAGANLAYSLDTLSTVVDEVTDKLEKGGRLIYVGAGTSGRLAAVDTVEIACTFGFPRNKVLTLIAGGVADASYDIETNFEEDASSIPDLLLLNLTENDVVVGISVSGSAFYVQSALGYAKKIGASSILIQETGNSSPDFCNTVIPLHSGSELIAGSTRMKAGTATKKIINFLSTSVMIKLGNVYGCYMVNLECINIKLINRAVSILTHLFTISAAEAEKVLKQHHNNLKQTIAFLSAQYRRDTLC